MDARMGGQVAQGVMLQSERRSLFAWTAVGSEQPVGAIADQARRGDLTLGDAILVTAVAADRESPALQECRRDDAEPAGVRSPARGLKDADAFLDLLPGTIAASEDPVQSLHECWDLPVQQARLEIAEELQRRQQGVDLGSIEPETWELIPWPRPGLPEAIPVARANIFDRRVEPIAHVDEIAFESCPGDPHPLLESRKRHDLAVLQQLVDLVEPFGAIHCIRYAGPRDRRRA